jgi:hypothetical protein
MGKLTRVNKLLVVNEILVARDIPTIAGLHKNLKIRTTGLSSIVTVTADEVILGNSSYTSYVSLQNVSLTANTTLSGLKGIDTGTVTGSTWYAVYIIFNVNTSESGLILSKSASIPTLPTGFTYFARLGWFRTDTTGNRYPLPINIWNNIAQYGVVASSNLTEYPIIISGIVGTTNGGNALTLSAVAVDAFIPPTANKILLAVTYRSSHSCILAPNNNATYNGWKSNSNTSMIELVTNYNNYTTIPVSLLLESRYIYAATEGANTRVRVIGWEDN